MVKQLLALLFLIQSAYAVGPISDAKVMPGRSGGFTNYVKNPSGFKNTRNITTSSASIARDTDASDKIDGIASLVCDASAQNGYCEWDLDTIQEGDKTGNCEASGLFKGDASLYKVQVTDGTNVVNSSSVLANVSDWTAFSVNYPCGSTRKIRLTQTESGTGAAVNVGRVSWSRATNIGTVSQAQFFGSITYAATSNCIWQNSGNATQTYQNFPADTDCPTPTVTGSVSAPGTKIPAAVVARLPPGSYMFVASGVFQGASAAQSNAIFRLHDGTNPLNGVVASNLAQSTSPQEPAAGNLVAYVTYSTAQSNITFNIQSANHMGVSATQQINNNLNPLNISIYRYPTSEETVYRPEVNSAYYSGYHGSGCSAWTRTNTAYGAITDDASGCTLTDLAKSGITAATSGSVSPALALTLPRTGTYYACAQVVAGGGSAAVHQFRLWDGTTTIAEGSSDSTSDTTISLCGPYVASSLTPTLTVQCKAASGTCTINSGASDVSILWSVFPLTGNVPAPVLVDRESVVYQDQKASGTAGGTFTSGSYATRTINTLSNPAGATWAGTPSSNQFTLAAGTYRVNGYATASSVGLHKAKLYNVTDSSDTVIGTSEQTVTSSVDTGASKIQGVFTITGTKTFEVRHRCSTTNADDGFGVANSYGDVEVYTSLEFEKIR